MLGNSRRFFFIYLVLTFAFAPTLKSQKTIATVKIGEQEWMSKNLSTETFRNGDTIPEAKTNEAWEKAYKEGRAAWCYYNNEVENGVIYGKLYNWFAVSDPRGLAPDGYHISSKAEWEVLLSFLGGQGVTGKKLKCDIGWPEGGHGTNEFGFSGLPGGLRHYNGYFGSIQKYGHWWTNTALPPFYAWQYYLLATDDAIGFYSYDFGKGAGMSVRCLKD